MTKLEQEAIEFMKKHPKDPVTPVSQHTETDLERQLAICEQNGTKWAHFKVADIRKLLAPVSGPEDDIRKYPCADCGVLRSKNEGGTTFTVCDKCWDKAHSSPVSGNGPEPERKI